MSEILEIKRTNLGIPRSRHEGREVPEELIASVKESLANGGEEYGAKVANNAAADKVHKDLDSLIRRYGYKIRKKTRTDKNGQLWVVFRTLGQKAAADSENNQDAEEAKTTKRPRTTKSQTSKQSQSEGTP